MNQYVNNFQCSKNNETGEVIIRFLQASPNLIVKPDSVSVDGATLELVCSVVMTDQNAKSLIELLSGVL